jgi:hypothetical protein
MHCPRQLRPIVAGALAALGCALASAQLFNLPAPEWVKPGTQLTYHVSYASVGFGTTLVPDDDAKPDENGMTWTDQNGQKYRPQEAGRSSGQAICEVTVAYLDAQDVVLAINNHGIDSTSNLIVAPQTLGEVGPAHSAGDFWMHPRLLQDLKSNPTGGVKVLRLPFNANGRTYDAIALTRKRPSGHSVQIFDLASGLLLGGSMVSEKPEAAWAPGPGGQAVPGGGGKILSHIRLVSTRQLELPWLTGGAVESAPSLRSLVYTGAHSVSMMGSPPMVLAQRATLTARRSGPGWGLFDEVVERQTVYNVPETPMTGTRASGPGQLGGLWLPPQGLRGLQSGQVLDANPVTRVQHAVAGVDGERVQIMATGMQHRILYTYDLTSGMLVGLQHQQQVEQLLLGVNLTLQAQN